MRARESCTSKTTLSGTSRKGLIFILWLLCGLLFHAETHVSKFELDCNQVVLLSHRSIRAARHLYVALQRARPLNLNCVAVVKHLGIREMSQAFECYIQARSLPDFLVNKSCFATPFCKCKVAAATHCPAHTQE
jgi:hypothetical protein